MPPLAQIASCSSLLLLILDQHRRFASSTSILKKTANMPKLSMFVFLFASFVFVKRTYSLLILLMLLMLFVVCFGNFVFGVNLIYSIVSFVLIYAAKLSQ